MFSPDSLRGSDLRALRALTKPGITRMVLITTAAGFWLAAGRLVAPLLLHTLVGTALVASGTNALNQWWERDRDGRMDRTRGRPLPAGRIAPGPALMFALGLGVAGVRELALFVNLLAAGLAAATLVLYVLAYTPLKPLTPAATLVGSVPGALPIVGGWVAAGGPLDARALLLFALLFFWQVPHFLALGWLCRDDYARAGFRTLGVLDVSGRLSARQSFLYASLLVPLGAGAGALGLVPASGAVAAASAGLGLALLGAAFARRPAPRTARRVFVGSLLYLPVVLLVLAAGRMD